MPMELTVPPTYATRSIEVAIDTNQHHWLGVHPHESRRRDRLGWPSFSLANIYSPRVRQVIDKEMGEFYRRNHLLR